MVKKEETYVEALKIISEKKGTGKNIAWHLMNGNETYGKIFSEIIKLMQKTEGEILISKTTLLRKCHMPTSAATYPFYKYENEDYMTIKSNYVHVYKYQRENWDILCSILQQ